jgi:hypothetical protein
VGDHNLHLLSRRLLAVAIVALVVAGVASAVVRNSSSSPHKTRVSAPPTWDPRVEPIAHFVEQERGLSFHHPVAVEFLPEATFKQRFANDKKPTAKEQAELRDGVGVLRALGLVQGDVDLRAAVSDLAQTEVVGYYDDHHKRISVRGSDLTPDVRETLAHELTHALQDQHFDLRRYDDGPAGVETAYRALYEADAVRIQQAFEKTLPADQRQALDFARSQQAKGANESATAAGTPEALEDEFEFPYVFGPAFVAHLRRQGGNDAVDRAFEKPPRSEAQIVDPQSYVSGVAVVSVPAPRLGPGQKRVETSYDVGQVSLLTVLGARVDYGAAWAAVRGWVGDQAIPYRQSERICVGIDAAMRTPADGDAFFAAASAWAAAMPPGASAVVTRTNATTAELRSCDPGKDATAPNPPRPSAFKALASRNEILAGALDNGAPYALATCAADKILDRVGPADMAALYDVTDENDPRVKKLDTVAQRAGTDCVRGR